MKPFLLSLVATSTFAALTTALTTNHAYEFNPVAVSGGGYITGIIAHPTEKDLLYTRTDIGGTYRWDTRSDKWIPLTDFISSADENLLGTESIALDPTDSNWLYLAQGRYLASDNAAFFVSDDRGERRRGRYVGVGVPNGLYVSTDSGETSEALPGQPREGVLAENGALYVTFADAPGPYGVLYGGVYVYNTTSSEWANITPSAENSYPLPFDNQTFPAGRFCGLSVAAKDPETLVVVLLDRDPGPALDSVYLSHDGGKACKDVSQFSTPPGSGGYWGHPIEDAASRNGAAVPWLSFNWGSQWGGYGAPSPIRGLTKLGWWMTAVLIDPSNSDHVLYGTGATIWATDDLSSVDKDRSPDWYIQAQGIEESVALAMASPNGGPSHLLTGLGDIHGYRYGDLDVPQPMFDLPTDGCGLAAFSADGGDSWTKVATCIPGIEAGTPNPGTIAIDASGKHIFWSSAMTTYWPTLQAITPRTNESGPYRTTNLGKTWISPTGFNIQTPNISTDRVQPKTFYSYTDAQWYLSTDGGRSYRSYKAKEVGLPEYPGAVPIANFNKAGEIWLALGDLGLYHTRNFGQKWTRIGGCGVLARHLTIGAGTSRSSPPALFIVGKAASRGPLSHDGVYRSDDNGKTWVRVNDEEHQYGGIGMIQGDPRVYGRVYLGIGGREIIYANIKKGKGRD
ncbi:hypothetical protein BJX70DRAFT_389647 [Aspergillus crustosus]